MSNIIISGPGRRKKQTRSLLHWVARISAIAVIALMVVMLSSESGSGPTGREWTYLAFFPFGFSLGYLLGWRWPLLGGVVSLLCMLISQLVIERTFDVEAYIAWGFLSVPGVLYLVAGLKMRGKK